MFMNGPPGFMNRGPRPMPPRPRPPFPGPPQQANNKPPPTTVFVGNITEHAGDKMIKELLNRCGNVLSWKRVQGASGKLQAFGFCEYEDPEATMRCIRLLHEWEIGDKKIVVRVDAKTKQLLENYKKSKGGGSVISSKPKKYEDGKEKSAEDGKNGEDKEEGEQEEEEEVLDEEILREDRIAKAGLEAIMREYVGEIKAALDKAGKESSKEPSKEASVEKDRSSRASSQLSGPGRTSDDAIVIGDDGDSSSSTTASQRKLNSKLEMAHVTTHKVLEDFEKNKLDAIEMEEEKKAMLRREIDQFRNTYKESDETERGRKERERERERLIREKHEQEKEKVRAEMEQAEKDRMRRREERERREREEEKRRTRSRTKSVSRSKSRSASPSRNRKSGSAARVSVEKVRDKSEERSALAVATALSETRRLAESRARDRDRDREGAREEEEDEYERKKMERKLRDKETAYQERLRNWEMRERKRRHEYKEESRAEKERKAEMAKEARRLKEFLEDYDDLRDDPKYYKGSALARRMKARDLEASDDNRDRQKEKTEMEELKAKLKEEGHGDDSAEIIRLDENLSSHLRPMLHLATTAGASVPIDEEMAKEEERLSEERLVINVGEDDADSKAAKRRPDANVDVNTSQAHPNNEYRADNDDDEDDSTARRRQPSYSAAAAPAPSSSPPPSSKRAEEPTPPTSSAPPFASHSQQHPSEPPMRNRNRSSSPENSPGGGYDDGGDSPPPQDDHHSPPPSHSHSHNGHHHHQNRHDEEQNDVWDSRVKPGRPKSPSDDDGGSRPLGFQVGKVETKRKKLKPNEAFAEEEDESGGEAANPTAKKPKLDAVIPNKPLSAEEKKKAIKQLIERIPTAKEELFGFSLEWAMVDSTLMEKRIKPWINKKIIEYIGEEEASLVEYICQKVVGRSSPRTILEDVQMVLDDEAEVFVVKMWRLLVYETEAKKNGLVKY